MLCDTLYKINNVQSQIDDETTKYLAGIFWLYCVVFDVVELFKSNKTYVKKEGTN
jgi:hypothetical protein